MPVPADTVGIYFAGAQSSLTCWRTWRPGAYIDLMYLIWEKDELTAEVTGILLDRIQAGVRVHILYDWLLAAVQEGRAKARRRGRGGRTLLQAPAAAELPQPHEDGLRRQCGRLSGGMNMGQEYIDGGERFETWRDTTSG